MRRLSGPVLVLGVAGLVACAAIAGLEDPRRDPGGGSMQDARTDGDGAGGSADAESDAADACSKAPNGASCSHGDGCCSGACTEERRCGNQCSPLGTRCSLLRGDLCCVGAYCPFDFDQTCRRCIEPGRSAHRDLSDNPLARTCCSGRVDESSGECR